jgi:hypothetical protein
VGLTIHIKALRGHIGHALALVADVSPLGQSRARGASGLDSTSGEHGFLVALHRMSEPSVLLRCGSKFVDGMTRVRPASRQCSRESAKHKAPISSVVVLQERWASRHTT